MPDILAKPLVAVGGIRSLTRRVTFYMHKGFDRFLGWNDDVIGLPEGDYLVLGNPENPSSWHPLYARVEAI